MRGTTVNAKKPVKSLLRFVEACVPRMPVYWIWPSGWKMPPTGNLGRSGRSFGTLSNGYKRREGPMEPPVARGFLTLLLNPDQVKELKGLEKLFPENRYLTGFEVCRLFHLNPNLIEEHRLTAMQETWERFQRSKISDGSLDVLTKAELLSDWMDWVQVRYVEPLPTVLRSDWDD
jgi:hypothetical protein